MTTLVQNIRHSFRQLLKTPSFSLTAIVSLALGIGGTVAVFSLIDAILLRPLQFTNEAHLVQVSESRPSFSSTDDPVAPPNYVDWKNRNHVFTDMGAARGTIFALTGNGRPEQVEGTAITANLLPLLGVKPLLGRNFRPEEDQPGARPVALISASLWQSRFGADSHITEKTIRLDGVSYAVAGVMPFGFTFHQSSKVWVPLALSPAQLRDRGNHFLLVYGLLNPNVTLEQARQELLALSKQLQHEYPESNIGVITSLVPLREQLVGKVRPAILVLAVGVLTILITTCANIAGLMIARSTTRQRELAIKSALGASRFALFYEHLLESMVLSICGAVAGILLATGLVPFLGTLVPRSLAAWAQPEIDGRALTFALLVCLLAATGFALASHRFLASHAGTVLRNGRATVSGDKRLLRSLLVAAQMALATVILIATSLLGQTFWKLAHTDLGFTPEHVLTMRTELPVSNLTPYRSFAARTSFYKRVLDGVAQIPGVLSAGYTTFLPLTNSGGEMGILQEGAAPLQPGQWNDVHIRIVTPDYFRSVGIRLVSGRFLTPHDNGGQAPAAVINQSAARKYWGRLNPIGRRFRIDADKSPFITIAGVIADVHYVDIQTLPAPEIYLSYLQDLGTPGYFQPRDLAIRVSGDPAAYASSIRRTIWSVDPEEPIADVGTLTGIVESRLASYQLEAKLFGWFAVASLLLSSIGIYGLLSYDVAHRTREIGLRMALGAERRNVVNKFVGAALRLCLIGIFAGSLASFALIGVLRSLLFGVAGWDGASRALAASVVLVVALAAAYLPARRAARIDPMQALRAE